MHRLSSDALESMWQHPGSCSPVPPTCILGVFTLSEA